MNNRDTITASQIGRQVISEAELVTQEDLARTRQEGCSLVMPKCAGQATFKILVAIDWDNHWGI